MGDISLIRAMVVYLTSAFVHFLFFHPNIFQAQKAKDKEENEDLVEELDKNFTSLAHSEALLSLTESNKMNALKALVNTSTSNDKSDKDSLSAKRTVDNSGKVLLLIHEDIFRLGYFLIIRTPLYFNFIFMAGKKT